MTVVNAHWAYWSKESGDDQDYRVLRCSTGRPAQFTAAVHAGHPGTPRTEESGRPDSLPWVVFGGRDDGGEAYCTVAVMEWTDRTDWTNRPITATTWATLPYSELSSLGAEYTDLYEALRTASLHDGRPAALELPDSGVRGGGSAANTAGSSGSSGSSALMLYWAAGVAALLLEGRVVVTGADRADAAERIAAIDAVSRMLPYGYRAEFSACTWAPVPEQAVQRLCFGDYAGGDMVRVQWAARVPRPSGPVAARYLDLLTGHLDAGEGERVLLWLRRNARSRPFDQPHRALEVLEALTLAELVLAEVRSGQGDADRVLKALNQKGVEAFDEEARRSLFAFLFERRDPALYPAMAQFPCEELFEAAASALHAALAPTPPGPAAAAAQAEAAAIVQTFVPPILDGEGGDGNPGVDNFVARLIAVPQDFSVPYALLDMWLERYAAATDRDWTLVASALVRTPVVGLAAVRRCAEVRPEVFGNLVTLLSAKGSAPWLTVLRWTIDVPAKGSGSAGTLAQAVRQCPGVGAEVFRFAAAYRRFDAVPQALWQEWLRIGADESTPVHAELGARIADFDPLRDEPTPPGSARLGLLLCLYGKQFAPPTPTTAREYTAELATAGRLLPRGADKRLNDLPVRMLRGILKAHRGEPGSGALTVEMLLGALDRPDDMRPQALGFLAAEALDPVGRLLPEVQDALAAASTHDDSWRRLVEGIPELALAVRLGQLDHDARSGGPTAELAGHWAWLQAQNPSETEADDRVRTALHIWPGLRKQGVAYDLLLDVRSALISEHGWHVKQADNWLVRTSRTIVTQAWLGREIADQLRRTLTEQRENSRAEEQLLTAMLGDQPPKPAPAQPAHIPQHPVGSPNEAPTANQHPRRPSMAPRRSEAPWYRSRRPLLFAAAALVVAIAVVVLFATGAFGTTPTQAPQPSGTANPEPRQASLASPFFLLAVLIAIVLFIYRRPRWSGQLAVHVRRDAAPGYQAAGVLVPDRLGRTFASGDTENPGLLQLPRTTARVGISARRAWLHPTRVELQVRVRLADSGRRDTVRCPVGGRRMILGLDIHHDPTARLEEQPQPPLPPRPEAPPHTMTAPHTTAAAPYTYPPPREDPTIAIPYPTATPSNEPPTLELPPRHYTHPHSIDEISGGPDSGGPGRWPNS